MSKAKTLDLDTTDTWKSWQSTAYAKELLTNHMETLQDRLYALKEVSKMARSNSVSVSMGEPVTIPVNMVIWLHTLAGLTAQRILQEDSQNMEPEVIKQVESRKAYHVRSFERFNKIALEGANQG